jgi:hypothetical protein
MQRRLRKAATAIQLQQSILRQVDQLQLRQLANLAWHVINVAVNLHMLCTLDTSNAEHEGSFAVVSKSHRHTSVMRVCATAQAAQAGLSSSKWNSHQMQADQLRQRFGGSADIWQQVLANLSQAMERQVAQGTQRWQVKPKEVHSIHRSTTPHIGVYGVLDVWQHHQLRKTRWQSTHPARQRDLQALKCLK